MLGFLGVLFDLGEWHPKAYKRHYGTTKHYQVLSAAICDSNVELIRGLFPPAWSKYSNGQMAHGFLRWTLKTKETTWARLLAYATGLVNQELLLQNEYLTAENGILRAHLPGLRLSDGERATLAEIGKRLGRKGLQQVARIAKPDTILGWYRKLVAAKFDGSKQRRSPDRPRIRSEIEDLVIRLARENSGWGYDRIVGALANLGHQVSDQTVGNILRRHGIQPVPERSQTTTWKEFIRQHMEVLVGTDFFTVEVLTWRWLPDGRAVVLADPYQSTAYACAVADRLPFHNDFRRTIRHRAWIVRGKHL